MAKLQVCPTRSNLPYLARCIAGQYSCFFRPTVFSGTLQVLLPVLRNQLCPATPQAALKIAVVGCSAGEEVYSLATGLAQQNLFSRVELRGIDRDPELVIQASRGSYRFSNYDGRLAFFSAVPQGCAKYFVVSKEDPDLFMIDPLIKKKIAFQKADATDSLFPELVQPQDVIIINNVLVHLPPKFQRSAIDNIVAVLNPGGRLITDTPVTHPNLASGSFKSMVHSYLRRADKK